MLFLTAVAIYVFHKTGPTLLLLPVPTLWSHWLPQFYLLVPRLPAYILLVLFESPWYQIPPAPGTWGQGSAGVSSFGCEADRLRFFLSVTCSPGHAIVHIAEG